jgi:hypothetical protein
VRRRSWLLSKALESHPLDQALDLARSAEAFITGSQTDTGPENISVPAHRRAKPQRRTGLALSPEKREQLLERLARGAGNAELAIEYGLSLQQVQGIRIGSAREIARRRDRGRGEAQQ